MKNGSLLYAECDIKTLRLLAARHFSDTDLERAELLKGGMFNTTYRLDLSDGRKYVLRLGPVNRHLLLPFEHGMMAAEAYVYELCAKAGICVPKVEAVSSDRSIVDRDYMLTGFIPSVPLSEYSGDTKSVYRSLGEMTARLHSIRGNKFGRVSEILRGGGHASWGEAILAEFYNWESAALPSGWSDERTARRVEKAFLTCVPVLDDIGIPALVHADLWAGNVLVNRNGSLAAIIDADRCLFGDPAFDFAEGWLDKDGFSDGYGLREQMTPSSRLRRTLYRLLYTLLDGYVYACEYQDHKSSEECRRTAMNLLLQLENDTSG